MRLFRRQKERQARLADTAERALFLQGQIAARSQPKQRRLRDLADAEFRVYSQWGEDGIIEWLVSQVEVPNRRFIEFGVEDFREANCRFLLRHRGWKGFVMDGSESNMASLRKDPIHWMYDLTAQAAFVTAENICGLIADAGFAGRVGLLSIDLDGNDYWVWKAIDNVDAAIVVCEYNAVFGDRHALSIPYNPGFERGAAHSSGLYWGSSIEALRQLSAERGYVFVGTNSAGMNAFFVKQELAAPVLDKLAETKAYPSRYRESRNETGKLTFVGGVERLSVIGDMPVVNVTTGATLTLRAVDRPYSAAWLSGIG